MSRCSRRAFTLVELLVVITVIAMLMALLFPAISAILKSAKKTACLSHLEEISKACRAYEVSKGFLPPEYVDKFGKQPVGTKIPWMGLILGNLDHADWLNNMQNSGATGAWAFYMDLYNCPDNPPDNQDSPYIAYAANAGQVNTAGSATVPADWKENGVFMPLLLTPVNNAVPMASKVTADFIATHDGLDKTLMLMETGRKNVIFAASGTGNVYPQGVGTPSATWTSGSVQPAVNEKNTTNQFIGNVASTHGSGACVVFASTTTRFLSDQVDGTVLNLMFTTDGPNAKTAGSTTKVPQTTPLTQSMIDR